MKRDVMAQLNLLRGSPARTYRWDDVDSVPDLDRGMAQCAHPLNSQYPVCCCDTLPQRSGASPRFLRSTMSSGPLIEDDFTGYVRSVLDRERIDLAVLDLLGDLREAAAGFPGDRYI